MTSNKFKDIEKKYIRNIDEWLGNVYIDVRKFELIGFQMHHEKIELHVPKEDISKIKEQRKKEERRYRFIQKKDDDDEEEDGSQKETEEKSDKDENQASSADKKKKDVLDDDSDFYSEDED